MIDPTNQPSPRIGYRMPDLPPLPTQSHWQDAAPANSNTTAPDAASLAVELGRSLQLSRAGALALTRLQLAMKSGDRHAAMAALDRLHGLDTEMERMVERLPAPAAGDPDWPEWDGLTRHVGDQKLALAFEKLALASAISGPDIVSPAPSRLASAPLDWTGTSPEAADPAAESEEQVDLPPLADWPRRPAPQPVAWRAVPIWVFGLLATVLMMVAVAAAVIALTGGY